MRLKAQAEKAPSSSEEGVGGGGLTNRPVLLERAASMRRAPTEPEHLLWLALRDSRLGGYKFRRQAVIGSRITDFFCPAKGLIVEVDGDTHDRVRDVQRDAMLQDRTGFQTLRFTNGEVMHEREAVLQVILTALEGRPDRWQG